MTSTPKIEYTGIFINNAFHKSVSGKTFPTFNPATEEKIVDVQEGDKADVDKAVAAAKEAFKRGAPWRTMDASNRGALMHKLADLIERDLEKLVVLETLDNGKPLGDSRGDIQWGIGKLRHFAGWADKICGQTIPADGKLFSFTRRQPVGVVGCILPWNFPLMLLLERVAVILACGCTLVVKPAEQTPLTALHFAQLSKEAGLPDGVLGIVPGYGPTAGAALTTHHDVRKISFTGSTEVGHIVMRAAADSNLKRVTLELGGKSPLIICEDADLDMAAEIAHTAVMVNQGQCCCAGTRTFVHSAIYDKMLARFQTLAEARSVGDPFAAGTTQGPQIDNDQFTKILDLIDSGKKEGARLVTGGARHGNKGYFIEPTVFADVQDSMRIAREEIFGPVQCIFKFDTLDEAIERANDTTYGLAAGIITNDINKAMVFAQNVEAGTVWVNTFLVASGGCPFGGFKMSGQGREGGEPAIEEYTEVKTVTMSIPEKLS